VNAAQRFRNLIAEYPRLLWLLGIGAFINVVGLSFIWPITTIYIHEHLGRPLTVAGWVLLFHSGGAALGSLAGGYLFDRIGARRVMLLGLITAAALIALPGLFTSWPLYVTVMFLYGVAASLVFPAMNALGARAWPEGGRRSFNFIYVCHNMGVAVGTALGGLAAAHSFQMSFLAAAVISLIYAAFVFVTIPAGGPDHAEREVAAAAQAGEAPIPWGAVGALFAGLLMCWLIYVQWQNSIAVFMQSVGISLTKYSALWTLNGIVIVAGQPLIGLALKYVKATTGQLLLGLGLFAASYGLLLTSHAYPAYVAGMIVLTLGEMLLWPGIPAAVAQVSPPSRKGFLQGIISSAATAGRMVGPLAGGVIYDHLGYRPVLLTMLGLLTVPALCFGLYGWTRR
jgi:MFS family permease